MLYCRLVVSFPFLSFPFSFPFLSFQLLTFLRVMWHSFPPHSVRPLQPSRVLSRHLPRVPADGFLLVVVFVSIDSGIASDLRGTDGTWVSPSRVAHSDLAPALYRRCAWVQSE